MRNTMVYAPNRQPADSPVAGQFAARLRAEPCLTIGGSPELAWEEQVSLARSPYLADEEAVCLLREAQVQIAAGDRTARTVIDALARNPSTPAAVLHNAVVFHDGTKEQERDWRRGEGSEATTRLVVRNPATAQRTLEVIAGTEGGKVRYEAWKQLKLRNAGRLR
jgi:hypothetical protein